MNTPPTHNTNDPQHIAKEFAKLQPPTPSRLSRGIGALFLIVITVGLTLGATRLLHNLSTTSEAIAPVESLQQAIPLDTVMVTDIVSNAVLLLVGTEGNYTEIKIADVTTSTARIQDLIRGKAQILTGALSPSGDFVAYIQDDADKRKVQVVNRYLGENKTVKDISFWAASQGQTIEPCFWSPIVWSPTGQYFAFFGCTTANSMLIIVNANTKEALPINETTYSTYPGPRQLSWFDENSLLHTIYNPHTATTLAYRFFLDSKIPQLFIYER